MPLTAEFEIQVLDEHNNIMTADMPLTDTLSGTAVISKSICARLEKNRDFIINPEDKQHFIEFILCSKKAF